MASIQKLLGTGDDETQAKEDTQDALEISYAWVLGMNIKRLMEILYCSGCKI